MKTYMEYKAALTAELEALTEAGAAQTLVNEAVKKRNWIDFNESIKVIDALRARIETLELERVKLMPEAQGRSPSKSFYSFAQRFPEEERRVLCELYRQIKTEAFKLRFSTQALANYIGESRLLVSGMLEAAFPEKRGKIYGRTGTERSAGLGGIVLDRRF